MVVAGSVARAAPSEHEKTLATTLFNEAKTLLADGHVPEACRKLEESHRLDPLPGTVLNLAVCHEKEGLLASAFAEFRQARALAERDGRADRVALADERLQAIEPRLSRLVVTVAPEVDLPELRITRDGSVVGRAAWGTRMPVDPGEHVIEASAPGKKPWRATVTVGREGDVQSAVVGPLVDDVPREPVPSPAIASAPARDASAREEPVAESTGLSTRRKIALASAGLGVVGLGLGSYFGLRAIQKHGDPERTCTTTPCSSTSVSLNDDAKLSADLATVSFAVGLAALGGAAFLWFGDTPARSTAHVRLSPSFRPGQSSLALTGAF